MRFNETEYVSPGQMDFVPRERRSQIWKVVLAFAVTMGLVFLLSFSPDTLAGRSISAFISMACVCVLCFYVIYRKQQSLDLVMATEYQNMLFAEAIALGSSFCLIVRRDGTIVYANAGLHAVFSSFDYNEAQALEGLFSEGGVPKADRERVMSAIYSNSSARLVFPVRQGEREKEYVLSVEPLTRPGGFALIRGREYRDQRAGIQLLPDVLRTTSADKLDHMLAGSPVGLYTTDAFGRLEYINPALEELLGYQPGELLDSHVSIHQLLSRFDNQPVPDDYTPAEHSGPVTLLRKHGEPLPGFLHQQLMRDASGKSLGASGTIMPGRP